MGHSFVGTGVSEGNTSTLQRVPRQDDQDLECFRDGICRNFVSMVIFPRKVQNCDSQCIVFSYKALWDSSLYMQLNVHLYIIFTYGFQFIQSSDKAHRQDMQRYKMEAISQTVPCVNYSSLIECFYRGHPQLS